MEIMCGLRTAGGGAATACSAATGQGGKTVCRWAALTSPHMHSIWSRVQLLLTCK